MKDQFLTTEDILCLQFAGVEAKQIIRHEFDDEDYDDAFESYIDKAESILARQHNRAVTTIAFHEKTFPLALKKIGADCPPLIHCLGDLTLLNADKKRVAIIGARAASSRGNKKAYKLGKQYVDEGYVIVSGLALGCDKSAHEGCLDVDGKAIAIVASGMNIVHPKENEPLQRRILESGGLILSEQPFDVKANPTRLVARNRLQAALSEAVILAECPEHSGSLHTMRFARKYHKRCFAAAYPKYSDINAGNQLLISRNLAQQL